MKIAIWKTGHEIADRVAESLGRGIPNARLYDVNGGCDILGDTLCGISYGILRGTPTKFANCESNNISWFNVDRGYFNPGHYDGYYRISYKGTQAKYDTAYPVADNEWDMEPIRKYDANKPVLVCPPTGAVAGFFGIAGKIWPYPSNSILRQKGDQSPIPWNDISAVVTFNSSVGWQAVQRGIPCLSDTTNSVVGSYYNTKSLDELIDLFNTKPRKPLFDFMKAHQFTLSEIEKGLAWPLINHYLSLSVGIQEKRSAQMLPPTPSGDGLKNHFQSDT